MKEKCKEFKEMEYGYLQICWNANIFELKHSQITRNCEKNGGNRAKQGKWKWGWDLERLKKERWELNNEELKKIKKWNMGISKYALIKEWPLCFFGLANKARIKSY